MQRLVIAFALVAILAGLLAMAARSLARASQRRGGLDVLTTGGAMQKFAFFLLLCLMAYVALSGGA